MVKKIIATLGVVSILGAAGITFAQTASTTPATQASAMASMQPVLSVNASGKTLLRGTIESVSATSITVQSWGGTWTVNVPASAQVLPQGVALSSFQQGDFVGVQGTIDSSGNWTVDATLVRDWTQRQAISQQVQQNVQNIKSTTGTGPRNYAGTVSNLSGQTFTLTTSGGTSYSVSLTGSAEVVQKNYRTLDFTQVQNGDSVRVWGTAASSSITASIFRDLSIPRQ